MLALLAQPIPRQGDNVRQIRERLIEIARYEIDKGLTGGTDEDVEVAERIVERFFTTLTTERKSSACRDPYCMCPCLTDGSSTHKPPEGAA
jgi:hypothetical protein